MRIGLFTPDRAFDMVSKAQIQKLKTPSIKLVDLVTTEMLNMCKDATVKVILAASQNAELTRTTRPFKTPSGLKAS